MITTYKAQLGPATRQTYINSL